MKLIVGISGASGVIYGIRLLEVLSKVEDIQTHLIISPSAKQNIEPETDFKVKEIEALADILHDFKNLAAPIASGSFKTDGMIVIPCSMKSLSMISNSLNENLLIRAADVTLKERRKLVLVPRETPLHLGHIKLMKRAAEMGAILLPPMPAFYNRPTTINNIIDQLVSRALDLFNIKLPEEISGRWRGKEAAD